VLWNRARLNSWARVRAELFIFCLLDGVAWVGFSILVRSIVGCKIFFTSSPCIAW